MGSIKAWNTILPFQALSRVLFSHNLEHSSFFRTMFLPPIAYSKLCCKKVSLVQETVEDTSRTDFIIAISMTRWRLEKGSILDCQLEGLWGETNGFWKKIITGIRIWTYQDSFRSHGTKLILLHWRFLTLWKQIFPSIEPAVNIQ